MKPSGMDKRKSVITSTVDNPVLNLTGKRETRSGEDKKDELETAKTAAEPAASGNADESVEVDEKAKAASTQEGTTEASDAQEEAQPALQDPNAPALLSALQEKLQKLLFALYERENPFS